jgi:chromosomal replication initiator protein
MNQRVEVCRVCQGEGAVVVNDLMDVEKSVVKRIIAAAASEHGVMPYEIVGRSRQPAIAAARFQAAYHIRQWFPEMPLKRVGMYLGGRDHSTISHGIAVHMMRMGIES